MDTLPVYPVLTFPARPAILLPAVGDAQNIEDVASVMSRTDFILRQDLPPELSLTPGSEGCYVFVEGSQAQAEYGLGGKKKKAKAKARAKASPAPKEKRLARKSRTAAPPRRRKKGESGQPGVKKFGAQGFNLKKMPLGVMTQLLFGAIWPDAYSVSQEYPKVKPSADDPEWFAQMDFNPHLYVNVEDVMTRSREGQNWPEWYELAKDCNDSGVPPYVGLYLFAQYHAPDGKTLERQIMEIFDFPAEAMVLLGRYEEANDRSHQQDWRAGDQEVYNQVDEYYEQLWQEYLSPYFYQLAYTLDLMKPKDLTGSFNFGTPEGSEEWGLMYEECGGGEEEERAYASAPAGDDDDEEDLDEPEGGDLNEP